MTETEKEIMLTIGRLLKYLSDTEIHKKPFSLKEVQSVLNRKNTHKATANDVTESLRMAFINTMVYPIRFAQSLTSSESVLDLLHGISMVFLADLSWEQCIAIDESLYLVPNNRVMMLNSLIKEIKKVYGNAVTDDGEVNHELAKIAMKAMATDQGTVRPAIVDMLARHKIISEDEREYYYRVLID